VIAGVHAIIYAEDVEAARAFFRDVLGFPGVDSGEGWLIFALPPAEIAMHPGPGQGPTEAHHELFLMCHDINKTIEELTRKGVEFVSPVEDQGWGLLTRLKVPGAGEIGLYQPKHPSPLREFSSSAVARG
jgi:catechol 2,3-dioxygenase-like lactoylglutathione lyase family enzyme